MCNEQDNESGDRVRRDIDDALRQGGADQLPASPSRRDSGTPRRRLLDWRPQSPGQVIIVGGIALLLAYLRLLGPLSGPVSVIGFGLLAFGVLTWMLRPSRVDTYWRGRRVDWGEPDSWFRRLYRAIYREGR